MAPIPNIDDLFETDESGNMALCMSLDTVCTNVDEDGQDKHFANFYPDEGGVSKRFLLFRHMSGVLKNDIVRGIVNSVNDGQSKIL